MTCVSNTEIKESLNRLIDNFQRTLYSQDETFLTNMQTNNIAGDDIDLYKYWEWPQGVGLYGLWGLYCHNKDPKILHILKTYYDERLSVGLPSKNINTMSPILTLSYLAELTQNSTYLEVCNEWAKWAVNKLPRTKEGGFQHITSDTFNNEELWDDTLFMAVLPLINIGRITNNQQYIQEGIYQFLLHAKYLADKKTGLWFHGFTFHGNHNFAEALWGRGNCWITMAIPILIEMIDLPLHLLNYFENLLRNQANTLRKLQSKEGMWHTLLDDPSSYPESSATCGIGYGILKAVRIGILDDSYLDCALHAVSPIVERIDQDGIVGQVSYGTPMGRTTKAFYKQIPILPMPYGQATAILFLSEVLAQAIPRELLEISRACQ